jgi:hypothetical protein
VTDTCPKEGCEEPRAVSRNGNQLRWCRSHCQQREVANSAQRKAKKPQCDCSCGCGGLTRATYIAGHNNQGAHRSDSCKAKIAAARRREAAERGPRSDRKCRIDGCADLRAVADSGWVYSWCREHKHEYDLQIDIKRAPKRSAADKERWAKLTPDQREQTREDRKRWWTPEKEAVHGSRRRVRKAKVGDYERMNPWPTNCQICGDPLSGKTHEDHEPPIAWLANHLDYVGPRVIRPSHASCNLRKRAKPDWERVCE